MGEGKPMDHLFHEGGAQGIRKNTRSQRVAGE